MPLDVRLTLWRPHARRVLLSFLSCSSRSQPAVKVSAGFAIRLPPGMVLLLSEWGDGPQQPEDRPRGVEWLTLSVRLGPSLGNFPGVVRSR